MEINLPLDASLQPAMAKVAVKPLNLKLDQLLSAKVVGTQIMLDTLARGGEPGKQVLTLNVADRQFLVQAQPPVNLQPGQSVQLQVVKLLPVPEFRIASPTSPQAANQATAQTLDAPILKLLNLQPQLSAAAAAKPSLSQLTAGQQLQATVVDMTGNKLILQLSSAPPAADGGQGTAANSAASPANTLVTLDAKQLVLAPYQNESAPSLKTPASALSVLTPGAQVDLKVLKTGDNPTFAVSLSSASTEQKVIELFKQLLPIQNSSAPLLNHLNQILPALKNDATIAETLKRLAQDILASIPLKTYLTEPMRLKQSIDQSGLFLESKLAQLLSGKEGADLQQDLKLKLVKFVQLLDAEIGTQGQQKSEMDNLTLLKEALQKTHATLAKLTLDQFQSVPKDDSAKLGWVLELPFFHGQKADTVQIEIEQDKQAANDNHSKNWVVSITITPPELGTIHCRVSCYDGSVNTRFWSDTADTVEKINAHLDYLKQQFEQKGLKTGFMEAHQGKPEATDSVKKLPAHLLSEKA
ncbi:MAG: flagellar hook-length control protein FliK [Methylomonas sp.]